jgi:hypothetical protein
MMCLREHVIKVTYTCDLPLEPMQLIVREDRESQSSTAFAGLGGRLSGLISVNIISIPGLAAVIVSAGCC